MYEYKIITSMVAKNSEKKFNELGREGWRLVRAQVDVVGSMVAVFEREIRE